MEKKKKKKEMTRTTTTKTTEMISRRLKNPSSQDPVEGGVAVNVGDMLSRWSDGRLLSNLHRVRMPELPAAATEEAEAEDCSAAAARYSLAFFMQADKSAMIERTKYEPITAGDYILGRIKSNFTPGTAGVGGK